MDEEEEEVTIPSESSRRFKELLQRLASEHESEVRALREEVARLREDRGEDEVEKLRAEVVRLQQYRAEPKSRPSRDLSSWLPLCHGCRDGDNFQETVEEDSLSASSMPVVVLEPALTTGGWAPDSQEPASSRRSGGSGSATVKGRLASSSAGAWDAAGDASASPEWQDPTRISVELDEVVDNPLDLGAAASKRGPSLHSEVRESAKSHKTRSSMLEWLGLTGDAESEESVLSEPQCVQVTEANPSECWRMLISYARGHVQCKSCWVDAVSNWSKSQKAVRHSFELGRMITILVPHRQRPSDTTDEGRESPKTGRWEELRGCLEVFEVFVSHPNCRRRIIWDMVGVILLMHDVIMLPMSAFNTGTSGLGANYAEFVRVFDFVSSCFWTMDIGVSFLTGYFTNEGFTEVRLGPIARHYIRSWFPLDLFIVSVDWISFCISGLGTTSALLRLGKTVSRFMRVLRLLRFMKLNTTLRDLLAMINSEYVLTLVNLLKILFGMVVMNHYIACVWYYLSIAIQEDGFYHTWTAETFGAGTEVRVAYAYSTSLHWSLTQFTPASMEVFPENEFERFFNIVVIIFALVIFSSFVSGITQAMTHIRNINSARTAREGEIRIFLSGNKISNKLASRIWRCVRQNNTASLGQRRMKCDDIPLLRMLPVPIKEELRQEVYAPMLNRHPLFREYFNFDPGVISHFCSIAVSEAALRSGDHAVMDWKSVKEFVLVVEGSLEYHVPGMDEPELVSKGRWACEACLWATRACLDGPLLAGASGAEIVKVDALGLQKISENHPSSADFLGRYAKLFITRFNSALLDEHTEHLFNNEGVAEGMINEVLKQCGKARGLSSRKPKFSGKDLATVSEVRAMFSGPKRDPCG